MGIKKRGRSFVFAFRGIGLLWKQPNAKIHLIIAMLMIAAGILIGINNYEWMLVAICIGLVLGAEAFNTALEKLCDHVNPGRHPEIAKIKDLSAGAVLLISIAAAVCGILILWNHYSEWIHYFQSGQ